MNPTTDPALEEEIDRLYALPLAEFITARNELAKRLRAGGDRQTADEVKALVKPSLTAWAVNTLYHRERERFDDLLRAATAVRAALAGEGDRRSAEAARRKALQTLLARAAKILAKGGHAATPANRQRVSHTLETLAARDPADEGPRAGRLTADLEPQGFDVLAGLAASLAPAGPAPASPATKPKRGAARPAAKKRSAGSAARAPADERLDAARRRLEERQAALAGLEREVEEAESTVTELVERHEHLTEEAAEAERLVDAAVKAAAAVKKELAAARAAATKAKAARRRGILRLATARRQLERHES